MKYKGFTLAETLITIAIIGVVAAIIIPVTMQNIQAHAWSEQKINFEMKLNEAMNQMKTNEVLTGYATSDDFADEFANYFKIIHRCDSSNLTGCFVPEFTTGTGEVVNTASDLKTGADFKKSTYTSPLVGLQFINGIQALIAYNPDCAYVNPYDNQASAVECLSMVYDLNGTSKPNVIGKDIITYHATIKICDGTKLGTLCVDANDIYPITLLANATEYQTLKDLGLIKYFYSSGSPNTYADDRWAAAVKACNDKGMRLPTLEITNPSVYTPCPSSGGGELCEMYRNKDAIGGFSAASYFSATEYSQNWACWVTFGGGSSGSAYCQSKFGSSDFRARCVK